MKSFKSISVMLLISLLLSLATFAFKQKDFNGCNAPSYPHAAVTTCQAYGPGEVQGWPLKRKVISGYRNILTKGELLSLSGGYNREIAYVIMVNLLFYAALLSLVSWLYITIHKRYAHIRHRF